MHGPSGDEMENEAERPRSTSTPKSGRGMDPDECDRLVGINSVDLFFEEDRFGDGELTDTENPIIESLTTQEPLLMHTPVLVHVLVLLPVTLELVDRETIFFRNSNSPPASAHTKREFRQKMRNCWNPVCCGGPHAQTRGYARRRPTNRFWLLSASKREREKTKKKLERTSTTLYNPKT